MATLTATFNPTYGFVTLLADQVPAGQFIFRSWPLIEGYGAGYRLPNFDYTVDRPVQKGADVLAPLGVPVTYVVRELGGGPASAAVTVTTPGGDAYLRHLFYPDRATKLNIVGFDDARPARLTTYAISGQRNAMATWDVRAGRDAELVVLLNSKSERTRLEHILNDGAPISLGMCDRLGNEPGIFAVADVQFERYGTADQWIAGLALTEVDLPRILAALPPDLIPPLPPGHDATYDEREAELVADVGVGLNTYAAARAKWVHYQNAIGP